jgi:hypothetical protein
MANDAAKIKYGLEIRRAPGRSLQSENEADIRRTDRGPFVIAKGGENERALRFDHCDVALVDASRSRGASRSEQVGQADRNSEQILPR